MLETCGHERKMNDQQTKRKREMDECNLHDVCLGVTVVRWREKETTLRSVVAKHCLTVGEDGWSVQWRQRLNDFSNEEDELVARKNDTFVLEIFFKNSKFYKILSLI